MDLDRSCLDLMIRLLELDQDRGGVASVECNLQFSAREIAKMKEKIRKLCDTVHNKHLDLENITVLSQEFGSVGFLLVLHLRGGGKTPDEAARLRPFILSVLNLGGRMSSPQTAHNPVEVRAAFITPDTTFFVSSLLDSRRRVI